MRVSFPGAHGVFSFSGQQWPVFFGRSPRMARAVPTRFFFDCLRILGDVRLSRLLRTGEPCDPRLWNIPTGDFFALAPGEESRRPEQRRERKTREGK